MSLGLDRVGDDAKKWAQDFRSTAIRLGYSDMDEGWLIGWFANAIEHSNDVRRWRREADLIPLHTASADMLAALEDISCMIANCAGVPTEPDSLPQMIKAHSDAAIAKTKGAAQSEAPDAG